jgi:arylsulfatase
MHFTPTYLDVGFDEMLLAEQDGPGRVDDDYHRWLMQEGVCDRNDLEDQRGEYRKEAGEDYWEQFGALTSNLSEKHYSTTWIGDQSLKVMSDWDGGGNMLMTGFIKPHHPFDPPEPWDKMYDPEKLKVLPGWTESCIPSDLDYKRGYFPHEKLSEEVQRKVMAMYYGSISQIDDQVGRMIEALKAKAMYDETMIIFTADHGDYMGFHHMMLKGNLMYDPIMRVPLIIK